MSTIAEKKLTINHAAVIVLTIVYQVVMMGWYTLFSEPWVNLQGKTIEDFAEGSSPAPYAIALGAALVLHYVLVWAFQRMNIQSGLDGLRTAFILGLGLNSLQLLVQYTFSMRPVGLALIDGGAVLLVFLIAGYVLGSWKKFTTK